MRGTLRGQSRGSSSGIEAKCALPVKFEVLAPNHRAIQVTDDLTSFWRDMDPKVKAELSRRYPRHEWR
jgi:HrpA-like RNA helicase